MPATADATASAVLAHDLRETMGRIIRRLRAEPGVPVGKLAVLGRLERDGPASISDLATCEHMRPQSMAQIVRDLESGGLVTRRPDAGDRRRAFIELTGAGRDLVHLTRSRKETWLTEVLDRDLDAGDRAILRQALAVLRRIADA